MFGYASNTFLLILSVSSSSPWDKRLYGSRVAPAFYFKIGFLDTRVDTCFHNSIENSDVKSCSVVFYGRPFLWSVDISKANLGLIVFKGYVESVLIEIPP